MTPIGTVQEEVLSYIRGQNLKIDTPLTEKQRLEHVAALNAIVIMHGWDLDQFYESMYKLRYETLEEYKARKQQQ